MTSLLSTVQNTMQLRFIRETSEETSVPITAEQKQRLINLFSLATQSARPQKVRMPAGTSITICLPRKKSNSSSSFSSVNDKSLNFMIPVRKDYVKCMSMVLSSEDVEKVQTLFQNQFDEEALIITVPEGTCIEI